MNIIIKTVQKNDLKFCFGPNYEGRHGHYVLGLKIRLVRLAFGIIPTPKIPKITKTSMKIQVFLGFPVALWSLPHLAPSLGAAFAVSTPP